MAGGSKRYSRNNSNGNFQPLPERGPGNTQCYKYHKRKEIWQRYHLVHVVHFGVLSPKNKSRRGSYLRGVVE